MRKRMLLLITLFASLFVSTNAQNYPVLSTVTITPPYSVYLSDYASASSNKLLVNLMVKDPNQEDIQVKLRITIKGNGIEIKTKDEFVPELITLQGGVATQLYGTSLEAYLSPANLNLSGLSRKEFLKTGKLPEGVYQFIVEAVEVKRNVVVSNTGMSVGWLMLNNPPQWILPAANSLLTATYPQSVFFSWMPMNTASPNSAFSTEYEFTIVEIWPEDRAPGDAINSKVPLYQTTTNNTSLLYGPSEPELTPGRKYVCRLRAYDTEGRDLFKNKGYSEILTFTFGQACKSPNNSNIQIINPQEAKISWTSIPGNTQFLLSYSEKNTDGTWSNWYINETLMPWTYLKSLKPEHTYRYQLTAYCGTIEGEKSEIKQFTTTKQETGKSECKNNPDIPKFDDSQPLAQLNIGDKITVGGFEATVFESTGSNGVFSGRCVVKVKTFKGVPVACEFNNIRINQSYQVTQGEIVTLKEELNLISIDDIIAKLDKINKDRNNNKEQNTVTDNNNNGQLVTNEFKETDSLTVIVDGKKITLHRDTTFTTDDGKVVSTNFKNHPPIIIVGDETTEVTPNSVVDLDNPENNNSSDLAAKDPEYESFLIKKVTFSPAKDQQFGFDQYPEDISQLQDNYEKEKINKNDYPISWKSLMCYNYSEKVIMNLPDLSPEIINKRLAVESSISGPLSYTIDPQDNSCVLNLVGKVHGQEDRITAYYIKDDGNKIPVGYLNTVSYREQKLKLIIVPVNEAYTVKTTALKETLDNIYKNAITYWDVSMADPLKLNFEMNEETGLDTELPLMTRYSNEIGLLIDAVKKEGYYSEDTYYLFLVKNSEGSDKNGIMPFGQHFGFMFMEDNDKLKDNPEKLYHAMAHELGHGFGLKHPWEEKGTIKGATNNLMDNSDDLQNNVLQKYQWSTVQNPEKTYYGGSQEEVSSDASDALTSLKNTDGTLTCITPAGEYITLPKGAHDLCFNFGIEENKTQSKIIPGTLNAFTINVKDSKTNTTIEKRYKLIVEGTNQVGYINEKDKTDYYDNSLSKAKPRDKVIMGFPGSNNSVCLYAFMMNNPGNEASELNHYNKTTGIKDIKTLAEFPIQIFNCKTKENKVKLVVSNMFSIAPDKEILNIIYNPINPEKTENLLWITKLVELGTLHPRLFKDNTSEYAFANKAVSCDDYKNIYTSCNVIKEMYDERCNCGETNSNMSKEQVMNCSMPYGDEYYKAIYSKIEGKINKVITETQNLIDRYAKEKDINKRDRAIFIDYPNAKLIEDINYLSTAYISKLDADVILVLISRLLLMDDIKPSKKACEDTEGAILILLQNASNKEYDRILEGLEYKNLFLAEFAATEDLQYGKLGSKYFNNYKNANAYLVQQLFEGLNDKIVIFGQNNRRKLMQILISMYWNSEKIKDTRATKYEQDIDNRVFFMDYRNVVKRIGYSATVPISYFLMWQGEKGLFAYNSVYTKFLYNGKIQITQIKNTSGYIEEIVKDEKGQPIEGEFAPFDLIAFVNESNLELLEDLTYNGEKISELNIQEKKDQTLLYPLPAIVVRYADQVSQNTNTETTIFTAMDAVSLAVGPGALKVATKAGRALICIDMVSDISSITGTFFSDRKNTQEVSQILNLVSAGTGGASLVTNLAPAIFRFIMKNPGKFEEIVIEVASLINESKKNEEIIKLAENPVEFKKALKTFRQARASYKRVKDESNVNILDEAIATLEQKSRWIADLTKRLSPEQKIIFLKDLKENPALVDQFKNLELLDAWKVISSSILRTDLDLLKKVKKMLGSNLFNNIKVYNSGQAKPDKIDAATFKKIFDNNKFSDDDLKMVINYLTPENPETKICVGLINESNQYELRIRILDNHNELVRKAGEPIDNNNLPEWRTSQEYLKIIGEANQLYIRGVETMLRNLKQRPNLAFGFTEGDGDLLKFAAENKAISWKEGFDKMGLAGKYNNAKIDVLTALLNARNNNGKIHFLVDDAITHIDLNGNPNQFEVYTENPLSGVTNDELRNICRNKDWFENTLFHYKDKVYDGSKEGDVKELENLVFKKRIRFFKTSTGELDPDGSSFLYKKDLQDFGFDNYMLSKLEPLFSNNDFVKKYEALGKQKDIFLKDLKENPALIDQFKDLELMDAWKVISSSGLRTNLDLLKKVKKMLTSKLFDKVYKSKDVTESIDIETFKKIFDNNKFSDVDLKRVITYLTPENPETKICVGAFHESTGYRLSIRIFDNHNEFLKKAGVAIENGELPDWRDPGIYMERLSAGKSESLLGLEIMLKNLNIRANLAYGFPEGLKEWADKINAISFRHYPEELGIISKDQDGFLNFYLQVTQTFIENKGKIYFRLEDELKDIDLFKDPNKFSYGDKVYSMTNYELRNICWNKNWFENTIFVYNNIEYSGDDISKIKELQKIFPTIKPLYNTNVGRISPDNSSFTYKKELQDFGFDNNMLNKLKPLFSNNDFIKKYDELGKQKNIFLKDLKENPDLIDQFNNLKLIDAWKVISSSGLRTDLDLLKKVEKMLSSNLFNNIKVYNSGQAVIDGIDVATFQKIFDNNKFSDNDLKRVITYLTPENPETKICVGSIYASNKYKLTIRIFDIHDELLRKAGEPIYGKYNQADWKDPKIYLEIVTGTEKISWPKGIEQMLNKLETRPNIVFGINQNNFEDFANINKGFTFNSFEEFGVIALPDNLFKYTLVQAILNVRNKNGKIYFRLDGLNRDIDITANPNIFEHEDPLYGLTMGELRNIVRNRDWFENTIFVYNKKEYNGNDISKLEELQKIFPTIEPLYNTGKSTVNNLTNKALNELDNEWLNNLKSGLEGETLSKFNKNIEETAFFDLFKNAKNNEERVALRDAYIDLSSSDEIARIPDNIKTVKNYKELGGGEGPELKTRFEEASNKQEYINELAKVFNKTASEVDMGEINNVIIPGTNNKIPLDLSDYCYDRTILYCDILTKSGFKVKKAFVYSKTGLFYTENYVEMKSMPALKEAQDLLAKSVKAKWKYHLAPMIECFDKDQGKIIRYIIDPFSEPSTPITIEKWVKSFEVNNELKISYDVKEVNPYLNSNESKCGVFITDLKFCTFQDILSTNPTARGISDEFKLFVKNIRVFDLANELRDAIKEKKSIGYIDNIFRKYKNSGQDKDFFGFFKDRFDDLVKEWFTEKFGYSQKDLTKVSNRINDYAANKLGEGDEFVSLLGSALSENPLNIERLKEYKKFGGENIPDLSKYSQTQFDEWIKSNLCEAIWKKIEKKGETHWELLGDDNIYFDFELDDDYITGTGLITNEYHKNIGLGKKAFTEAHNYFEKNYAIKGVKAKWIPSEGLGDNYNPFIKAYNGNNFETAALDNTPQGTILKSLGYDKVDLKKSTNPPPKDGTIIVYFVKSRDNVENLTSYNDFLERKAEIVSHKEEILDIKTDDLLAVDPNFDINKLDLLNLDVREYLSSKLGASALDNETLELLENIPTLDPAEMAKFGSLANKIGESDYCELPKNTSYLEPLKLDPDMAIIKPQNSARYYKAMFTYDPNAKTIKGLNPENYYSYTIYQSPNNEGMLRLAIGEGHFFGSDYSEICFAAGRIKVDENGKIVEIDDESGHYKPTPNDLTLARKFFETLGVTNW